MRRVALLALVLLCALSASADGSTGRCFAGASGDPCVFQTGKAVHFADGDTIGVDLDGDRTHRVYSVRLRAINAMELHRYSSTPSRRRGECHAVEAANRTERLIRAARGRVRLSAQHPRADARGRLLRWVAIRRHGRWEDLGAILLREGHALWMDSISDTAFNPVYKRMTQEAAAARRGIWNPTHCGVGPHQDAPIRVWANWNPDGVDSAANEWIKIQNRSASETLQLGGWWVRDAMLRRFTFPAGTSLPPGATLTVHVGSGTAAGRDLFWGLSVPIFENAGDARGLGDGAYLFDPRGDLRAWMLYPCVVACADPLQGAVDIAVHPNRPETVTLSNVSGRPVDLYGYALATPGSQYPFPAGTVLAPGERAVVFIQGDPADDRRLVRHWGRGGYLLPDAGGRVSLISFSFITLACASWGSASCG